MKETDYCPRAATFDKYLTGSGLTGIEIGVDVGAHAEAIFLYADIEHLTLVDIWDKEFYRGYCIGRLRWYMNRVKMVKIDARKYVSNERVDFAYFDIGDDAEFVSLLLNRWWPLVNNVIGVRGAGYPGVIKACKEFNPKCIIEVEDIILPK